MLRRVLFRIFLTTILLAPLPFASNRPWSWSILGLIIGGLVIAEGIVSLSKKSGDALYLRRVWPGVVIWSLVTIWIFVQSITGMSPDTAHPLFLDAAVLLGQPSASSISLDSQASLTALMRLLTYGGVFWLATRLFLDADNSRIGLKATVIGSSMYATYGLVVFFSGNETI